MKTLNKIDQTGKELIPKSENSIVVVNIPDDVIDVRNGPVSISSNRFLLKWIS